MIRMISLALCCSFVTSAFAQTTINFDDLYALLGHGVVDTYDDVAPHYQSLGITISSDEPLVLGGGNTNGDPGGFGIDGTNGPSFLAMFYTTPGGTITFSFDQRSDVSLDTILGDNIGGESTLYTVRGYRDGNPVFAHGRIFVNPEGSEDGEVHSYSFKDIDTLVFELRDTSWRVLAFDNIVFNPSGQPRECRADFNDDGETDFFDLSQFLQELSAGCP